MQRQLLKCLALCLALTASLGASAGVIVVSGDTNLNLNGNTHLSTFYTNLFGGQDVHAAPASGFFIGNTQTQMEAAAGTFTRGGITSGELAGKDWFIGGGDATFDAAATAVIVDFFAAGGNILLFGEGVGSFDTENANVTALLGALGSSLSVGAPLAASSSWEATGANIGVDPFTTGINRFSGNFAATVSGGTALFTNDATGRTIVAVERINGVPEPGTLALLGIALAGVVGTRRRRG